jgi:hypothetical protein
MIQENPEIDKFKLQLRDSLQSETLNSRSVKVPRHNNVDNCGDGDGMIYFIETGQAAVEPDNVAAGAPLETRTRAVFGSSLR